jgi:amino acid permease
MMFLLCLVCSIVLINIIFVFFHEYMDDNADKENTTFAEHIFMFLFISIIIIICYSGIHSDDVNTSEVAQIFLIFFILLSFMLDISTFFIIRKNIPKKFYIVKYFEERNIQ